MSDGKKSGPVGVLSVAIDPLLLEGGRRVNKIAELLVERFSGQYTKRQLVNNIRSRMNVLVKKGYVIERDATESRIVKLVPVETASPAVVQ